MPYDDRIESRSHLPDSAGRRPEQPGLPRLQRITVQDTDQLATVDDDGSGSQERARDDDSRSILWEITETLVLALLIFLAVRTVVLNFRVDGLSMEPSLDSGQMLLVNRQIYFHFDANGVLDALPLVERDGENVVYPFHPPQRGDIVVFEPPVGRADKPYIKRVIGLPGERISIHDGGVFINGERLKEPYIGQTATSWPGRSDDFKFVIPEEHIFVLGDNRNNSTDSRSFGPVSVDEIIGKAWISYWPAGHLGIVSAPQYVP